MDMILDVKGAVRVEESLHVSVQRVRAKTTFENVGPGYLHHPINRLTVLRETGDRATETPFGALFGYLALRRLLLRTLRSDLFCSIN